MKPVLLAKTIKLKGTVITLISGKLVGGNQVLLAWSVSYTEKSEDIPELVKSMKAEHIAIEEGSYCHIG